MSIRARFGRSATTASLFITGPYFYGSAGFPSLDSSIVDVFDEERQTVTGREGLTPL